MEYFFPNTISLLEKNAKMQTGGSLFCCSRYELLEQFHTGPSQRTAKMILKALFGF